MNQCENSVALGRLLSGRELEQVARGIERVLESVSEAVDRGGVLSGVLDGGRRPRCRLPYRHA